MVLGLHLVVLEVTGRCNLSCSYCYRSDESSVDMHSISTLLNQLAEIKPYFINISGGEPLLFKDLFILANELKKLCKNLLLTTNGTLVQNYPQDNFKIFDHIQISLDGNAQIHEYIRGDGTFEQVIDSARYLKDVTPVSLLCTVSSYNSDQVNIISKIAQQVGAVPTLGRMCQFGRGDLVSLDNPFSWKKILDDAAQCGVLNDDPLNFWFNEKKRSSLRPDKIVGGCTAGIAGVAISPELDVYPCVKLRISAGNLNEQSLKDIWLNSPLFASLRDWNNLKGPCSSCQYVSVCRGCRADAWARTGDYLAPDPLCWLNGNGE